MPNRKRKFKRPSIKRVCALIAYDPKSGRFTWRAKSAAASSVRVGDDAGTTSGGPVFYRRIGIDGSHYRASAIAFVIMEGRWPKLVVDHKNGDTLDDRWSNLREATRTQNGVNARRQARTASGAKGVYPTPSGRFTAWMRVYLGTFKTRGAAMRAHADATQKLHGQFTHPSVRANTTPSPGARVQ